MLEGASSTKKLTEMMDDIVLCNKRRRLNDDRRAHSELACKALDVVLSHWMIPDLGWHMSVLEERLTSLREEIIASKIALSNSTTEEERTKVRETVEQVLVHDRRNYMDIADIRQLKETIEGLDVEQLIPAVGTYNIYMDPFHYRPRRTLDDDFEYVVKEFQTKYWRHVTMVIQHQAIMSLSELHFTYLELQMSVVSFFRKQREELFVGRRSVIVHQIVSYGM